MSGSIIIIRRKCNSLIVRCSALEQLSSSRVVPFMMSGPYAKRTMLAAHSRSSAFYAVILLLFEETCGEVVSGTRAKWDRCARMRRTVAPPRASHTSASQPSPTASLRLRPSHRTMATPASSQSPHHKKVHIDPAIRNARMVRDIMTKKVISCAPDLPLGPFPLAPHLLT